MAGLILKFDPDEAIKQAEKRIGRPLTEEEKKTCKSFMLGMMTAGIQMGESFAMQEPEAENGAGQESEARRLGLLVDYANKTAAADMAAKVLHDMQDDKTENGRADHIRPYKGGENATPEKEPVREGSETLVYPTL